MIRVGIVEDHPLYRQGLIQVVEQAPDVELVFSAASLGELKGKGEVDLNVLLLDLHLPDGEGVDAVSRALDLGVPILVVSASDDRKHVVDAIAAGASGYLPKSSEAAEITRAISTIAAGGTYVSPILAAYLLRETRDADASGTFALTAREREILSLLAEGETDASIGEQLFISVSTVRSHLDRIRDKTGRRRRAELARLAFEGTHDGARPKSGP